jgi:hypothetical protein
MVARRAAGGNCKLAAVSGKRRRRDRGAGPRSRVLPSDKERKVVGEVRMQYVETMIKTPARKHLVRRGTSPMRMIALLATALVGALCALAADGRAIAGVSCHDGNGPAGQAVARRSVAGKFERLYKAWHREARTIAYSSNTHDYIALPSYRRIVDLGRPALPFLEKKLSQDREADFMLADAVVQICRWDRRDLASDSGQAFRDNVLRRLRSNR